MTSIKAIAAAVQGLEAKLQTEIDQTGADLQNLQAKLESLRATLDRQGKERKELEAESRRQMEMLCDTHASQLNAVLVDMVEVVTASLEGHAKTTHAAIVGEG